MQNIDKLIKEIIPPDTREERDGFTNDEIVSGLNSEEFKAVEKILISELEKNDDLLIGQTLVIMESKNAIPILKKRLEAQESHFEKITWAALINELNKGDSEMENIAFKEFEQLEFIYATQGGIFMELIKFESPRINDRIEKFVDHKYEMVAHHAKMVLNYNGYADRINKRHIPKKWWEFWK